MDKIEKIMKMYEYARTNWLCKNKKTFAELIGVRDTILSRALAGGRDGINLAVHKVHILRHTNDVLVDCVEDSSWLLFRFHYRRKLVISGLLPYLSSSVLSLLAVTATPRSRC